MMLPVLENNLMISASELKKHSVEEVNSNAITNQHDGNQTSVD